MLLHRLGLPFAWQSPAVDETARPGEDPEQLASRLAAAKAGAVSRLRRDTLVIGSDQVAVHDANLVGKPRDRDHALRMLLDMRGAEIRFVTGLHVIDGRNGREWSDRSHYAVCFRQYSVFEAERYVDRVQPFNCTAAFKSEELGVALVERMDGDDPTGLIGLPLIRLCGILREAGLEVP